MCWRILLYRVFIPLDTSAARMTGNWYFSLTRPWKKWWPLMIVVQSSGKLKQIMYHIMCQPAVGKAWWYLVRGNWNWNVFHCLVNPFRRLEPDLDRSLRRSLSVFFLRMTHCSSAQKYTIITTENSCIQYNQRNQNYKNLRKCSKSDVSSEPNCICIFFFYFDDGTVICIFFLLKSHLKHLYESCLNCQKQG